MQRFYSPAAGGFFSEDVHGARHVEMDGAMAPNPHCMVPDDAIPVSEDIWRALLVATSEGKIIAIVEGQPVAVDQETGGQA